MVMNNPNPYPKCEHCGIGWQSEILSVWIRDLWLTIKNSEVKPQIQIKYLSYSYPSGFLLNHILNFVLNRLKMRYKSPHLFFLTLLPLQVTSSFGQDNKATTGPVFTDFGAVYSLDSLDFPLDTTQHYKAIFDVDSKLTDLNQKNSIISSLHRYYNMHVRSGVPKENIHLAFVLHGNSTKDALSSSIYKEKFKVDNPNRDLIKSPSEMGVDVFICGQSMLSRGYGKEELLPEIKVALSAMTVLTVYQMNNYALIKF